MQKIFLVCFSMALITLLGCKKDEEPNEVKIIGNWESVPSGNYKKIMMISEKSITITPYEADGTPSESISGEVVSKTTDKINYRIYYTDSDYSAEFEYDYFFGENGNLFFGNEIGTFERYTKIGD
tara:strand:+ start:632 stop:1006 length:375 start_codon:yes stop_codon:yes gene_type:complete